MNIARLCSVFSRKKEPPVWLIGSGASKDAGLPLVGEINAKVIESVPAWRNTYGTYFPGHNPNEYFENSGTLVPRIQAFIQWVVALIRRNNPSHKPHYEEVFFIVQQLDDDLSEEYENPALQPLIKEAEAFVIVLNARFCRGQLDHLDLGELAQETANYMVDLITAALSVERTTLGHAHCLLDCITELGSRRQITVATLNHDTVLEEVFSHAKIKYCDGFRRENDLIRVFGDEIFEGLGNVVNLLKLHGSVGWKRLRILDGVRYQDRFCIISDVDRFDKAYSGRKKYDLIEKRSHFLVGTHNKILNYIRPVFSDLHFRFKKALQQSNRLVVVGYGFSDKGINGVIINWLFEAQGRRMIVINPRMEDLRTTCRTAIRNHWEVWKKRRELIEIPKTLEQTKWRQIKKYM